MTRRSQLSSAFGKLLAFLGPGLFLIAYNVGTGTVTTMASAGSRWGVSLGWTVLLSCVFTYVGVVLATKYTLVTGETLLFAIRRHLPWGRAVALGVMTSLILGEFAGIAGLMAIIVDLLQEWLRYATGVEGGAVKLAVTVLVLAVLWLVLWRGTYAFLEKIMAVFVGGMGLSLLVTAVLLVPSWREIVAGLAPRMPQEPDATLIVAGMAGTTFSTALFFARSITIKAKGWTLAQIGQARVDAAVTGFPPCGWRLPSRILGSHRQWSSIRKARPGCCVPRRARTDWSRESSAGAAACWESMLSETCQDGSGCCRCRVGNTQIEGPI